MMQQAPAPPVHGRHSKKKAAVLEHSGFHVPVSMWRVPQRYELRSLLGSGAYGTVGEALDREKGRMVAIKRIPKVFDDLVASKRILREVAILARLDDPHVVRVYDIVVPAGDILAFNELFLIMEIGDTDLKALMQTDIAFTEGHVKWIFYNFLAGLKYLHAAGVYHRDLKPSNVLVNKDCAVKICDFGLARAVGDRFRPVTPAAALPRSQRGGLVGGEGAAAVAACGRAWRAMTKHVATRFYRAPELILLQDSYTEAIDVWSAGCIYAEMTQLLEGTRAEERGPLFPGATCFPLSPDLGRPCDGLYHSRGRREQLNVIFDVLGTPTEDEVDQFDREDARSYIRCFAPRPARGLRRRLPHADSQSIDLLEQMLRIGPMDRISAEGALGHKLLADIRDPNLETAPPEYIELDFDKEQDHTEGELRQCFAREINSFRGVLAMQSKGGG